MPQDKTLITSKEACKILNTSRATLNRMIHSGEFYPAVRISGRSIRIIKEDLDRWIEEGRNRLQTEKIK